MLAARWAGRVASVVGVVAWSFWLAWRLTSSPVGVVSVVVLVLEVAALLVSIVLSAALWSLPDRPRRLRPLPASAWPPSARPSSPAR